MVCPRSESMPQRAGFPSAIRRRLCHGLRMRARCAEGLRGATKTLWKIQPEPTSDQNTTDCLWPPLLGARRQQEDSRTRREHIRLSWLHSLLGEDSQRRVCGETQDSRQADEPRAQSDKPMVTEPTTSANQGPMGEAEAEVAGAFCLLRHHRQRGGARALPRYCQTALAQMAQSPKSPKRRHDLGPL